MPGILRVDQANVDYIYAKTAGGKVYIPGHVIQAITSYDGTQVSGNSTSYVNLWTFTINNVSYGSKIIIHLTYSNLWEGSEGSEWRIIRNQDSAQVGVPQNQKAYSASGWAHVYGSLIVTDLTPTVGTNSYTLQVKGTSTAVYYYNYPGSSAGSYSFVKLEEVAQ